MSSLSLYKPVPTSYFYRDLDVLHRPELRMVCESIECTVDYYYIRILLNFSISVQNTLLILQCFNFYFLKVLYKFLWLLCRRQEWIGKGTLRGKWDVYLLVN